MRLEEALRLSKVESFLDGKEFGSYGIACREYNKSNATPERLIVAFNKGDFAIVYKDTLKMMNRNPFAYDSHFLEKVVGQNDWEPLTRPK